MGQFRVTVTEQDIEKAHRNDSYKCVVAQAIARTVKDAHRIEVDTQAIRFSRKGERLVYMTPYAVQGYVVAFDAGDPIEPFSFQLRSPRRTKTRESTHAGKIVQKTAATARRRIKRSKPEATPAEVRAAVTAAYSVARAEQGDPKMASGGQRTMPPRVFKEKSRTYGHRRLRINRPESPAAAQ